MDERKWSRIRDFAIGAQMLMLDHLLHRIPIDWGISDDEKVVISMCNRYCNPQALCMGWCIHNQLADNGSHYADWVASLKEMIAVNDGAVESKAGFYRIRDIKVCSAGIRRVAFVSSRPAGVARREPRGPPQQGRAQDWSRAWLQARKGLHDAGV